GSAVYSPDREHGDARLDELFAQQVKAADALVMDSQYTPEEYDAHRGWGHSTWAEAVKVAKAANVKKLVLFHHDPAHSDEMLRLIEIEARQEFAETYVAREGWALDI
ncbi:MAG: MBL fold metallo-hydrolase, partial [Acidobacteriota bacterium]